MNPTDTPAAGPTDDGTSKTAATDDDTGKPYQPRDPKAAPQASPGPDTREEPNSPK